MASEKEIPEKMLAAIIEAVCIHLKSMFGATSDLRILRCEVQ
jgi:hypothetical protein